MNKDQIKGGVREAAGKVQKEAGKLTGNTGHQVKGMGKEAAGSVQKNYGDAKEAVKDAGKDRNEP